MDDLWVSLDHPFLYPAVGSDVVCLSIFIFCQHKIPFNQKSRTLSFRTARLGESFVGENHHHLSFFPRLVSYMGPSVKSSKRIELMCTHSSLSV